MVYFEVFSSCSIQHLIELAESNQVTHTAKTPFTVNISKLRLDNTGSYTGSHAGDPI